MVHDARVVRMNAEHLPPTIRKWMGDSVGHWEGDTLVVDTTNFTNKTQFHGSSENLHVVERFTRVDPNDAALPLHGRRSDDVGSVVDRRVSVARDRRERSTSTPATKATTRSAACCAARGSTRPTKPRRAKTKRSKTEDATLTICLATQHADAAFTPLALLYLKAYLVERLGPGAGEVVILEFPADTASNAIAEAILASAPDVVGLSCYVWNVRTLAAACREIKARRPETRLVLGGPEVGPVAAAVLRTCASADVVVRGEGERPFAELIARWTSGGRIDEVAGITFRCGSAIRDTPDAPILADLNELPSPHLTLTEGFDRRVICLETQRGCVFRCNFCFYNKDLSIRNRRFELGRVEQELRHWLGRDVDEIYLMDPIFNLNAARAKAICRFIAAHNPRRIAIHAEVWAEFIDAELAQLMRAANFQFVEVGLQSTDDTALATVERRLRLQQFVDGVAHLQRSGVPWELQLIFGLPGDTRESFRKSLNFASRSIHRSSRCIR